VAQRADVGSGLRGWLTLGREEGEWAESLDGIGDLADFCADENLRLCAFVALAAVSVNSAMDLRILYTPPYFFLHMLLHIALSLLTAWQLGSLAVLVLLALGGVVHYDGTVSSPWRYIP
jgi:hypothetical protein